MPILDAALAFALTMLVVAMLVTQIVRLLQAAAKLRKSGMEQMLKEFFDHEFEPVVLSELSRLKKKVTDDAYAELGKVAKGVDLSKILPPDKLAKLVHLPAEELIEHLKRSEFGQKIQEELSDDAQGVFDQLEKRYEVVGQKFTASFRAHSRIWATGIALLVALAINIDSIHIAETYIQYENVSQEVIAKLDTLGANTEKSAADSNASDHSNPAAGISEAIAAGQSEFTTLTGSGFPIGWSQFPYSGTEPTGGKGSVVEAWIFWILGILLTAVLAGLGAPFWYDAVTGISRVAQGARSSGKSAG